MQPDATQPTTIDARYIPWLIVGFFVVIAGVLSTFVYLAVTTYRGVVTEQAYEKGVAYNDIIARAEGQDKKGWLSSIEVDGRRIVFTLRDQRRDTIKVDAVDLVMFRPTQDGMDRVYTMQMQTNGSYVADVSDLPATGIWEVRITAQAQQGAYQTSKRVVIR